MIDTHYMKRAIELAKQGCGHTNPNPMVGAVIVKDGEVIGEGYHARYGDLHAERAALKSCTQDPRGADLYVTLEPCCHHGKQPPCTDAIIDAGIRCVIVGSPDPNALVAGKGIEILKQHNIQVHENVLRDECDQINYVFFHYIKTKRPYVVMKYAMTMDGKIATVTGASKWVTGEAARQKVHQDRNRYMGIMAGIGTVLEDDPLLTCRLPQGNDPIRIICDTNLRIPTDSQIVRTAATYQTIIATGCSDLEKEKSLLDAGCQIMHLPKENAHIDLDALMGALGEKKIDSILLEGGGQLNWSALHTGIVNRVQTYIAPKIFGGLAAPSPVRGDGVSIPDQAFRLKPQTIERVGDDLFIESEVIPCSQESLKKSAR